MIFIPILAFIAFWFYSGNTRREPNWRAAFIQALIMWWSYMVIITELLGFFRAITRLGLSIAWLLVIIAFAAWFILKFKKGFIFRLPIVYKPASKSVFGWDLLLTLILIIPLIIGFIAPPNSQEAMGFGMTRVAHWAQERSLNHFATQDENLNSAPPGIGIGLLNMYVLSGSDRWCNFIPWMALLGCIQAIIAISQMFGSKPEGSRQSAVFGASLPIALALASGCLDDLPATLWVVSYVMMVFFFKEDHNYKFNVILAAFAAGLAFITKPVTLLLLIPFGIYLYSLQIGKIRFSKILTRLIISALIILGMLSGFIYRNFQTYGTAFHLKSYFNTLNEEYSLRVAVSNLLRNSSVHADLPFPRADSWLSAQIVSFHQLVGLDPSDPRITYGGAFQIPELNTSEMRSGNPLHALTIFFTLFAVFITYFKQHDENHRKVIHFSLLLLASYLLFNLLLKWQPTGTRWQLPYFFLFAPVVGFQFSNMDQKPWKGGVLVSIALVLFSLPWLFSVKERPVLPIRGLTSNRSILSSTRKDMYFNTAPENRELYIAAGDYLLAQEEAQRVGLIVDRPVMEYPLWAVSQTLERHTRIESLSVNGESKIYVNPNFEPTGILSDDCDPGMEPQGFKLLKTGSLGKCFYVLK